MRGKLGLRFLGILLLGLVIASTMRCPVASRIKVLQLLWRQDRSTLRRGKARVEPRQEVQAPQPVAPQKGITWWVIPLSLFLLFVILPLISYFSF